MRIILSRKGFDSSSGGGPSPIMDGKPVSLPIPSAGPAPTCYRDLGHGDLVERATGGKLSGASACHDDPMFADGHCWFGQWGSAQGHLASNGVREGDVFLFFGLFAEPDTGERHHRLFGYQRIACRGAPECVRESPSWREPPRPHPHLAGDWPTSNTLYFGPGAIAWRASDILRLTRAGGPLNRWLVPPWLKHFGLSYHGNPRRWLGKGELDSVKRGQEFVCDIGDAEKPREWLEAMIAEIEG